MFHVQALLYPQQQKLVYQIRTILNTLKQFIQFRLLSFKEFRTTLKTFGTHYSFDRFNCSCVPNHSAYLVWSSTSSPESG